MFGGDNSMIRYLYITISLRCTVLLQLSTLSLIIHIGLLLFGVSQKIRVQELNVTFMHIKQSHSKSQRNLTDQG